MSANFDDLHGEMVVFCLLVFILCRVFKLSMVFHVQGQDFKINLGEFAITLTI